MANGLTPTAANIISSLGIKGSTVDEKLPGFIPVLNESGEIDRALLPGTLSMSGGAQIGNVAVVDPAADDDSSDPNGPFISLSSAAESFVPSGDGDPSRSVAFLMAPGEYSDISVNFPGPYHPLRVYFIGIGECRLKNNISVEGISYAPGVDESGSRPEIVLYNIIANVQVKAIDALDVSCLGRTYVSELLFSDGESSRVMISAESRVSSTNASKVYLSRSDNVGNDPAATGVAGATVCDAIGRLGRRKLRIAKITSGESGFDVASSDEDVSAESSSGCDVFDISSRDRMLAEGVNSLFRRGRFRNVDAESISATSISSEIVDAKEVDVDSVVMGGFEIKVDHQGYLVVGDANSSSGS